MMLPKFVHILVSLDVNAVPCVNSMSTVCYTLCRVFGKPFTLSKFASILRAELVVDENSDQDHTRILAVLNGQSTLFPFSTSTIKNKTGASKVGAISRAQKAQFSKYA